MRFTVSRMLGSTKKPTGRRPPVRVASSCGGGGGVFRAVVEGSWRPAPTTGGGQEDEQEEDDTDASECGEEEKAFFEDLKRVRRGELISAARVDLPRRISVSRRLRLLGKKVRSFHGKRTEEAGAAPNQARTRARSEVEDELAEREEEKGSAEGGGGGLCEKKILLGRRSKGTATSGIEETATAAAVASAFQKAERP